MRRRKLYVLQDRVGVDAEDSILPTLVRIFYFQTMPRSDIIHGRLERSVTMRTWPTLVQLQFLIVRSGFFLLFLFWFVFFKVTLNRS